MDITPFTNKINLITGTIIALLSYIFGVHWIFFVAFLVLNVFDYITGCLKSRLSGKLNSSKGVEGILKKLGYWIMIMVSFGMSAVFIEIGTTIGIKLEFTSMIGWITLITLIINEFRSILENLVEAGYHPPSILIKGLEAASKVIDEKIKIVVDEDSENEPESEEG